MIPIFLISASVTMMITVFILSIRNHKVLHYRLALLDRISVAAKEDIEKWRAYEWRYRIFQSVPYNRMNLEFWKPMDSFYPIDPAGPPHHYTCPLCYRVSHNMEDMRNSYCGCCGNNLLPKNCEHWRVPVE